MLLQRWLPSPKVECGVGRVGVDGGRTDGRQGDGGGMRMGEVGVRVEEVGCGVGGVGK
jgi:hypothetical protein